MSDFIFFLKENSDWIFGGSSVAAILIVFIQKFMKKTGNNKVTELNRNESNSAGRDIIQISYSDQTKIALYLSIVIVFGSAILLTTKFYENGFSPRDEGAVHSDNSNVINSGDNSTNVISTGGSNVSN
ncbi:hypothetical protein [Kiloniella sp.]|uniref:hypothetical protein n=1 Tax=Kiloniella sp. TaxID=1938587 RepID=UPI003B022BDE